MTQLKAIKPKKAKQQKPKILVFGKSGCGKTWTALDFPSTYFIDTEGGATLPHYTEKLEKSGGVYLGVEQGSLDFNVIISQVKALATEKHEYKTLVIDSISKVYNTAISDEVARLGSKDAFGASKKKPIAHMRQLIAWLSRIDMNVILIAHEKAEYGRDTSGQAVEVGKTFDCYDKLEYDLDLCLHVVKAGQSRNAFVRKSRIEAFKDSAFFPWSYEDFAEKYGRDIIEKQGEVLELATAEQISRIKQLISTVNLPDGQESKWLAQARVEGWEEVPTERIDAAIKHIEKTYLNEEST